MKFFCDSCVSKQTKLVVTVAVMVDGQQHYALSHFPSGRQSSMLNVMGDHNKIVSVISLDAVFVM